MIQFFPSVATANEWLRLNPEWTAFAVTAGHISGSVLVLVVKDTDFGNYLTMLWALRANNNPQECHGVPQTVPPKRKRGRPPKVKDAQVS